MKRRKTSWEAVVSGVCEWIEVEQCQSFKIERTHGT